jgi:hypothetical protein
MWKNGEFPPKKTQQPPGCVQAFFGRFCFVCFIVLLLLLLLLLLVASRTGGGITRTT